MKAAAAHISSTGPLNIHHRLHHTDQERSGPQFKKNDCNKKLLHGMTCVVNTCCVCKRVNADTVLTRFSLLTLIWVPPQFKDVSITLYILSSFSSLNRIELIQIKNPFYQLLRKLFFVVIDGRLRPHALRRLLQPGILFRM